MKGAIIRRIVKGIDSLVGTKLSLIVSGVHAVSFNPNDCKPKLMGPAHEKISAACAAGYVVAGALE